MHNCLAQFLRMPICIIYVDSNSKNHHTYFYGIDKKEEKPVLNVYFRPGHYDLIYDHQMVNKFYEKELKKVFGKKSEIIESKLFDNYIYYDYFRKV